MISSKVTYSAALLLSAVSAAISLPAAAGLDLYALNSKLSTGTCASAPQPGGKPTLMECYGSFYGIRAQRGDPNRWVEFGVSEQGSLLFWMNFNGNTYSCAAPNTQGWKDAFVTAASSSAFFDIWFDPATGQCTSLFGASGSQFKSASAL